MRTAFLQVLMEEANRNKDIVLLTGDLGFSLFEPFREKFPDQFFNMGVAEQNMIGVAAGLALRGKKVFVYSIIPFVTFRCLEQIRNDLCYHDLGVVIVGVGSGISYSTSGFSHHSISDIGALKSIPKMTILSPSDPIEVSSLVRECINYPHPVYLRLGKNNEQIINQSTKISINNINYIKQGSEIALITHGNIIGEVNIVYNKLREKGHSPSLISIPTIKPLNEEILDILKKHKHIVIVEEHNHIGGLGDSIFNINKNNIYQNQFLHLAVDDKFITRVGSLQYLRKCLALDANSIFKKIVSWIKNGG